VPRRHLRSKRRPNRWPSPARHGPPGMRESRGRHPGQIPKLRAGQGRESRQSMSIQTRQDDADVAALGPHAERTAPAPVRVVPGEQPRLGRFRPWLDHRTGYRRLLEVLLIEHIPGGAKWRYVWGSTLVFVFTVQLITGILLMTAYSPGDSTAWGS